MFWELWLNKHGGEIKSRVPAFLAKQVGTIVEKLTAIKTLEDLRRYYPLPTEYDYEQTAEGEYVVKRLSDGAQFRILLEEELLGFDVPVQGPKRKVTVEVFKQK